MTKPLISVIIRSVDRPELRDALSSIAEQTYPNAEVVLINALGSEHSAQNPRCGNYPLNIYSRNRALPRPEAANFGLECAKGDLLIFLDDDDWFLPHHLEYLADALIQDKDVGAAYAAVDCVKKDEQGEYKRVHLFSQPFDRFRLLVENYIPMHALMFRREFLDKGCRFDERLSVYEDWDFWIQLSRLTRFINIDQIGAYYRITQESGFGMVGDEKRVRQGLKAFFNKWRDLWTEQELLGVVEYAKHHSMYQDLKAMFFELDKEKNALLEDKDALIREKNGLILEKNDLVAEKTALHEKIDRISVIIDSQSRDVTRLISRLKDIEESTSWKITAPLRFLSARTRSAASTCRVLFFEAGRLSAQGFQTWKSDGTRVLISRAGSKLSRYRKSRGMRTQSGRAVSLDKELRPIDFPRVEQPLASIIIPVRNQHIYTFNCLKSVFEHTSGTTYQVILVDDASTDETSEMLGMISGIKVISNDVQKGFVHSCNFGAEKAEGEYLVFLNNDTLVTDNWLESLLSVFRRDEDVGLAGPKLLYPDGLLQEAGGIVWRDGSTWNLGRLDSPDQPEYNYFRRVDYCSGACLAIPRELFSRVGGFDPSFAPAYFEDVDLAFKVREAGKKVCYQPKSVIYHFEGSSSGKTVTSGLKGFQSINRRKFHNKWKHILVSHRINGDAPHLEKDRFARSRMLVVDKIMLTPDKDSGSLRMFNLLEELVKLEIKVVFATMYLDDLEPYKSKLQDMGVEVIYRPHAASVEQYLQNHGRDFDMIMLSRMDTARFFMPMARRYAPKAKVIFDTVDLHFLREERMAELHNSKSLVKAAAQRKDGELELVMNADITLVVSPFEADLLAKECPGKKIEILSNIHEIYGSRTDFRERKDILFIGGFDHPPNTDAALYLVNEILPLVIKDLGEIKTYIIGSNPTPQVQDLASEHVTVTGFVQDISGYFDKVRLSVAPLRYGAGVKGKVNMSMSFGVPVVATSIAVEGMHLTHEHDVIIGDSSEKLAEGIVELYRNRDVWEKISSNGLINVEKHFSRRVARQTLDRILKQNASI